MNEVSTLNNLVTEIKFFEKQSVLGIWEIGKRLIQIKEMLGHGDWSSWVQDNLNYSQYTAINYMNLYKDYPNFESIPNLSVTKLFLLGKEEKEARNEILENENLEDKTVKETKEIIQKYKELEEDKEELEEENENLKQANQVLNDELRKKINKEVIEKTVTKEVIKEVIPSDYETIKRENKILQEKNTKLELEFKVSKMNDNEEAEKIKSEIRNYKWLVINFVKDTTPLLNLVEQIKLLPKEEQTLLMKSTENLLGFANNLYEQMKGL